MAMMDDEQTQTRGIVNVFCLHGMTEIPTHFVDIVRRGGHIPKGFSIRRGGLHLCYNNHMLQPFVGLLHQVVSKQSKIREKFHFGSKLECQYALRSYGIHVQALNSNQDDLGIEAYLSERKRLDKLIREKELSDNGGFILYPTSTDVLIGRGKPYQEYSGNVRLSSIATNYIDEYRLLDDKMDKTLLSMKIVQDLQGEGCRFLKRTEQGWVKVDDQQARGKVVAILRMGARKQRDTEHPIQIPCKRIRLDEEVFSLMRDP